MASISPNNDTSANNNHATGAYFKAVESDYPRNASIIVLFEFLWGMGMPFAMFATNVPAYLTAINSPKVLIGVITSLPMILCPIQIISSRYLAGRPKKKWLTYTYVACVIPWLLHNLLLFYYPDIFGRFAKLTIFSLCTFVFFLIIIANDVVRFSMITECTPLKKRGSLFGVRTIALAGGLLLMWKFADVVFARFPEPQNFLAAFAVGNLFYFMAPFIYLFIKEHRNPAVNNRKITAMKISRLVHETLFVLKKLLRNSNYRIFLFFMTMLTVSVMNGSFIIVFAREKLSITGSQILTFSIILCTTAAFFCYIFGKLADRLGYRFVGILQGLLLSIAYFVLAYASFADLRGNFVIYLGFFFFATVYFSFRMVMRNFSIELVPDQDVAVLIALGQLVMLPVLLLAAPIAGLIIDLTDAYFVVFILGLAFALASSLGFVFFVKEPRKMKLNVIKPLTHT